MSREDDDTIPFRTPSVSLLSEEMASDIDANDPQAYPRNRTLATLPKKKKSIFFRAWAWLFHPQQIEIDPDADEEAAMARRRVISENEYAVPSIYVKHQREPHSILHEPNLVHLPNELAIERKNLADAHEANRKMDDRIIELRNTEVSLRDDIRELQKQAVVYEDTIADKAREIEQLQGEVKILFGVSSKLAKRLVEVEKVKTPKKPAKKTRPRTGRKTR